MSTILNSQRIIKNLEELKAFWQEFLPHLNDRCILLMSGDVGAGKTTSVQMMASVLGMRDVQSPSFAIHLRYENAAGKAMDHLDLYRLKDDDDLESSGFWDLFAQKNSLIVIEWANRLDFDYLPLNWQRIEVVFEKLSDTERKITTRIV
ncbi:tRNA (adenosine(37)-N6)-threonylcarbamoyltransferase complex ATPase subunit type 1 TsaE [Bdellovibrio bacteriovorus]|uniref:tRNA (adenosine(37)-N6)-threonylcarbamoyltransferase complex ATPase subunit type 1 TsaE n=1 Tax=Bdellovibrio bacteriovorus TaxID=959 RepID=UPI0021CFB469|nr:tRNA (adenosine(37)-N6)-threonylcarbamoyltransferase complex ATPase subunit type 1 TsaE [Bdellovibrio bacteriovorus]UXR63605.1 tRNA (adenosine(37)-N6)-threonylcarbamoyltransferase complex ATPase subunit type 1 TsaE [Bdellovibrio bacteriovorus]